MSEHAQEPEKIEAEVADGVDPDTESDPSLDDGAAGEWADEGGAVDEGPATDPEAAG